MATQLKSSGAGGQWSKMKDKLQDASVDQAINAAATDMMYAEIMEADRKKRMGGVVEGNKGVVPLIRTAYTKSKQAEDSDFDSDDEAFLNDPEIQKIQDKRKEELKAQYKAKQAKLARGYGEYVDMDEKDMLKMACKEKFVIIHFHASGFERCDIFDKHLGILAKKHLDARFVKCDARKSPFTVRRWKVRTLPTVCVIVNGYLLDKIIGFEDLGNKDDFGTHVLAKRLSDSGAIKTLGGKRKKKQKKTASLTEVSV